MTNQFKYIVAGWAVGTALMAQAGFGDFLKKTVDVAVQVDQAQNAIRNPDQAQPAVATPAVPQPAVTVPALPQPVVTVPAVPQPAVVVNDGALPGVVNEISMDELAKRIKANPALVVIDVRSEEEFASGHIPSARNMPVDVIGKKIKKAVPLKATPVYLYCRSGARASTAGAKLVSMGYQRVYNAGGIGSWDGAIMRKVR